MKRLAILGASGHGKVIADIALLTGWGKVDFFDDRWPSLGKLECWSVVGDTDSLLRAHSSYDGVVVGIGNNPTRIAKQMELYVIGARITTLVHPSAVVSPYAELGKGSVVMANATVSPFVKIGGAVILNTSCIIDHDCILGDGVHISPGASLAGDVQVGSLSWVGIGATIIQQVTVGENVVIGAGAIVIDNISHNLKVVGSPARPVN